MTKSKEEPALLLAHSNSIASPSTMKGELACAKFELRALELGYIVSRPAVECSYDRIMDAAGKLFRVQVKYAGASSNSENTAVVDLVRRGERRPHGYTQDEIDAVVAYVPEKDVLCWFTPLEFEHKTAISIRLAPSKNNQTKNCNLYEDYVW